MNKIKTITILKIITIIILFWALADNPYGYYQILRWVVFGVTGYSAYLLQLNYEQGKNTWFWIMTSIAILFNPIIPIYLDRGIWSILDIVAGIIIFVSIFKIKTHIVRKN